MEVQRTSGRNKWRNVSFNGETGSEKNGKHDRNCMSGCNSEEKISMLWYRDHLNEWIEW